MNQNFQGWNSVAKHMVDLAKRDGDPKHKYLNKGQCASLRGIAERLPRNGVVIADEVGMGKTRIAVAVARSVIKAGGRVAILVPTGLGFQWQDELRDSGVKEVPELLRSLWQFFEFWMPGAPSTQQSPWFHHNVVLVSHTFANWRFGEGSAPWRWALLPALYAWWKKHRENRFPSGFKNFLLNDRRAETSLKGGDAIAKALAVLPEGHASRRRMEELCEQLPWPGAMQPADYARDGGLRSWLEMAVGLGLGCFDLVIVDEAHKNRGDESGLSRLLDQVIVSGDQARRFAMTATPVELDADQWHQTLNRIGARGAGLSENGEDIFKRYTDTCVRVRQCPHDSETREAYREIAALFQKTLQPYLLRRDKREMESVQIFADHSGRPFHDYRQLKEIFVDTKNLDRQWQQAVCAAEALSIVTHQADDSVSKRLRLTMSNGHGIGTMLDHAKQDEERDSHQIKENGVLVDPQKISSGSKKRLQRVAWWKKVVSNAFSGSIDPLYDHPAILATVDEIEKLTAAKEKALVFGRFTLPLHALVTVLNARAMLKSLDNNTPWPQSKVCDDEWPAIQAAHRQLRRHGKLHRKELDEQLERQYRELESRRRASRKLLDQLDAGLQPGRARTIFEAIRKAVGKHHAGQGESPLVLIAKALHTLIDLPTDDNTALATAFEELIGAISERDEGDENNDGELDATEAEHLWESLQVRLENEYNRVEGGFARLMYGGTEHNTRRLLQLAFNRPNSNPRVLVAQSVVGREGLNLHRACKTLIILHPEWNPGVVEQQIGRVDRFGSKWEADLIDAIKQNTPGEALPRILIRPVVFRGTYDEHNWSVLQQRWDDLRAQLHGIVISSQLAKQSNLPAETAKAINECAPSFLPPEIPRQ